MASSLPNDGFSTYIKNNWLAPTELKHFQEILDVAINLMVIQKIFLENLATVLDAFPLFCQEECNGTIFCYKRKPKFIWIIVAEFPYMASSNPDGPIFITIEFNIKSVHWLKIWNHMKFQIHPSGPEFYVKNVPQTSESRQKYCFSCLSKIN